jgi:hypothetical protein
MALFQAGQPKTGGRTRGVKNRLSYAFITALVEDFEKHGAEAIRICRVARLIVRPFRRRKRGRVRRKRK